MNAAAGSHMIQIAPAKVDWAISAGALLLLALVLAAWGRAAPAFSGATPIIWLHMLPVVIALVLTPLMLLRTGRGDPVHRMLGYVWCGTMLFGAASSFQLRMLNGGHFSLIHILSVITIIQVARIIHTARAHQVNKHRRGVRILSVLALLGAGYFTFGFDRLLGVWLLG